MEESLAKLQNDLILKLQEQSAAQTEQLSALRADLERAAEERWQEASRHWAEMDALRQDLNECLARMDAHEVFLLEEEEEEEPPRAPEGTTITPPAAPPAAPPKKRRRSLLF